MSPKADGEEQRARLGSIDVHEPLLTGEQGHREGSAVDAIPHPQNVDDERSNKLQLLVAGPALLLCTFVVDFDISFLSTNYSRRIASALHDLNNAGWILLMGSITETAFQPLYGHIAQLYGRRKAMLMACLAVTIGFLFCSLSFRLWQLALSRVVAGMGTSGVQLLVGIIVNDLIKLRDVTLWRSAIVVTSTAALMVGGPFSSAFTDKFGWHASFFLEFAAMLLGLVAIYLTLNPQKIVEIPREARRVDVLGTLVLLGAVAVPLCALNLGGNMLPWNHPLEIAFFIVTPFLWALFYFVEKRPRSLPIIPMRFLRLKSAIPVFVCVFPVGFGINQLATSFALYVEARSFEKPSAFNDWALTCIYFGRPLGVFLAGLIIRRYSKFKPLLQANIIVTMIVYLLLAVGVIHGEDPRFVPILAIIGLNLGISEGCLLVSLLAIVRKEDQAPIYAFFDLVLALSGDIGIALALVLTRAFLKSSLKSQIGVSPALDEIMDKIGEGLEFLHAMPAETRATVLTSYISSIEKVFGVSCGLLIASSVSTFFMREMRNETPSDT